MNMTVPTLEFKNLCSFFQVQGLNLSRAYCLIQKSVFSYNLQAIGYDAGLKVQKNNVLVPKGATHALWKPNVSRQRGRKMLWKYQIEISDTSDEIIHIT